MWGVKKPVVFTTSLEKETLKIIIGERTNFKVFYLSKERPLKIMMNKKFSLVHSSEGTTVRGRAYYVDHYLIPSKGAEVEFGLEEGELKVFCRCGRDETVIELKRKLSDVFLEHMNDGPQSCF